MTVLYGASGVGKSSVLLAGVVPMLRKKPRTAVVVFREWHRPDFLAALKKECIDRLPDPTTDKAKKLADKPLDEILHHVADTLGGTVLLLFDQFEEYFLYHPEMEAGNSFDGEFARAVNRTDVDAGFLLALRDDGLSGLDRFKARIPNLMGNLLRLRHLDEAAAEEAVRKPLAAWNERLENPEEAVNIEDALVREIIEQVRSGAGFLSPTEGAGQPQAVEDATRIETPFLQLVLTRLWEEESAAGSRILRSATLENLGGAREIVRTHLDAAMAKLAPAEQELCAGFFDRMVTPSGTKVACRLDDLHNWAGNQANRVLPTLQVLSDSRILRTIAAPSSLHGKTSWYEIFHDVLAPAVLVWRRRFIEQQNLEKVRREEESKREEERVRTMKEWELAEAREKTGRMKGLLMSSLVVAVFLGALAFIAYQQREQAMIAKTEADGAKQAAVADQQKAQESEQRAREEQGKAEQSKLLAVAEQEKAKDSEKRATKARVAAEEALATAESAQKLARERLHRVKDSVALIKAALSDKPLESLQQLEASMPGLFNHDLQFKAAYKDLKQKNKQGDEISRFRIFPLNALTQGPGKTISTITYRTPHPSFKKQLVQTGPDNNFTMSYIGWGTIDVIAIIEYADPEEAPTFAVIDMDKILEEEK